MEIFVSYVVTQLDLSAEVLFLVEFAAEKCLWAGFFPDSKFSLEIYQSTNAPNSSVVREHFNRTTRKTNKRCYG